VRELNADATDADLPDRYKVTGIVEKGHEPNSVLLLVGSIHLLAQPNTFRRVGDEGGVEAYSPTFRIPKTGSRVSIDCWK
jgi:hypothetical protein